MKRVLALLALVLLIPVPGSAGDSLDEAREARRAALSEARMLTARLEGLSERYRRIEVRASQAVGSLIDAYRDRLRSQERLFDARDIMQERARAMYRAGPGAFVEVLLGSASMSDLLRAREIFERAFVGDIDRVAGALDERLEDREIGRVVEGRKRRLAVKERRLEALRREIELALGRAQDAARRARVEIVALERERRRLQAAARRAAAWAPLLTGGVDQRHLLALLGPDGGRGCDIPSGLRSTGEGFSGIASWYGWDFAGRPTASGAIFDPRLFTAAHRTLPLPSFLHVRHAGRCATVLVNDRGPFIEGRVLDLSQAAAEYLGVGLSHVEAEILVPKP